MVNLIMVFTMTMDGRLNDIAYNDKIRAIGVYHDKERLVGQSWVP